jgi:5'-nucleotidase
MNILITNDDGAGSDGILKLAGVLRSGGKHRVFIIAPDTDRSGVSHSMSIIKCPVKLSLLGEDTWSCSGTPVDCVIVAVLGALPVKPGLVLSGINRGENSGTDIVYSGTAAAARQAGLSGIPAIALSLDGRGDYNWDMAASWSASHLEELMAYWEKDTFVNVNIPNNPLGPQGIKTAFPAVKRYEDSLNIVTDRKGDRWIFLDGGKDVTACEAGSDVDVVSRNFVSVSVVVNQPAVRGQR